MPLREAGGQSVLPAAEQYSAAQESSGSDFPFDELNKPVTFQIFQQLKTEEASGEDWLGRSGPSRIDGR